MKRRIPAFLLRERLQRLAIGTACIASIGTGAGAALDLDSNGYPDVWEARYHVRGLTPEADADGDGQSNLSEAIAGTNPFDAGSRFSSSIGHEENGSISITLTTQPGKRYQLLSASSGAGSWEAVGEPVVAGGESLTLPLPAAGDRGLFKASVTDHDNDGDGVDDWSERQLQGFNPAAEKSFPEEGRTDLAIASSIIQAWRSDLKLEVTQANAYEKEQEAALLTARRMPAAYPLTVFLKKAGAASPSKSSATAAHHQPLPDRLVIPANQTTGTLAIQPVANAVPEVPRQLTLSAGGSLESASFQICDAKNTLANQRLLLAPLRPLSGVPSSGSGLAIIKLSGDNDSALASVSFSNLNSAVNSTQILNASSAILQSIPPFNYGGQTWPIRATQSYTTDQAVLDALLAGQVKLGIYTQAHVTGEIEGIFHPVSGSIGFEAPPAPLPIESLTGDELERDIARFLTQATFGPTYDSIQALKARVAAAGGDRIAAYSAWIDEQLALPSPSLLAYTQAANAQEAAARDPDFNLNSQNRRRGWWLFAIQAKSQLKQRFAFAASEIFVVSDEDAVVNRYSYGAANYHDQLAEAATGRYRALLRSVSLSPVMGTYLSHLRNEKATFDGAGNQITSPDENYAREIMQLLSIGLVQLHPDGSLKLDENATPIPTYTQTDISNMSRVFTGWSFSKRNAAAAPYEVIDNNTFALGDGVKHREAQWTNPLKAFPARHDTDAKNVLGVNLPAGNTANQDLNAVLDLLRDHPNTAPFISRRLIQRFVTANPSPAYLYRVSQVFRTSTGDFPALLKAILLDPEARAAQNAETPAGSGKVREPLLRATAFMRAFGAKSSMALSDLTGWGYPAAELDKFPEGTTRYRLNRTPALDQSPLSAPSVFNWFLPDYSPSGIISTNGIVSPELQIITESTAVSATNFIYNGIYTTAGFTPNTGLPTLTGNPQRINIDISPLQALYLSKLDTNGDGLFSPADTATFNNTAAIATAAEAVVDRIDLLLTSGELKARFGNAAGTPRRIIVDAVAATNAGTNASTDPSVQANTAVSRIRSALWLVAASPQGVTQR
ncbi:DUF1800 domain-containing protein [Luteolibacter luteus]|uniref:DUF1800 family protein n=1 Tax=Luteolibacter luteus TaxID=2728835 RepID=A0A858RCW9_9BACT|nr:DUF1800 family protein [Luteolibacter luteus]QJE94454.1 DUF1800 family protein [Luteolibacter luteus]